MGEGPPIHNIEDFIEEAEAEGKEDEAEGWKEVKKNLEGSREEEEGDDFEGVSGETVVEDEAKKRRKEAEEQADKVRSRINNMDTDSGSEESSLSKDPRSEEERRNDVQFLDKEELLKERKANLEEQESEAHEENSEDRSNDEPGLMENIKKWFS